MILGRLKNILIIVVLGMVCSRVVEGNNSWQYTDSYEHVLSFKRNDSELHGQSWIKKHPLIRQARKLCKGFDRLKASGQSEEALQIVRANESVLQEALEVMARYRGAHKLSINVEQLRNVVADSHYKNGYESVVESAQTVATYWNQEEFEKSLLHYDQVVAQHQSFLKNRLAYLDKNMDKEDLVALQFLDDELIKKLVVLRKKITAFNSSKELVLSIREMITYEVLWTRANVVFDDHMKKIEREMEQLQGLQNMLDYLESHKVDGVLPSFMEKYRRNALANLRYQRGHSIQNQWGMQLVYIPAGSFMMGSPVNEVGRDAEEAQHQVILTRGFFIGTFEVTNEQWNKVMQSGESGSFPKVNVSWHEAQQFCEKLSKLEQRVYRLPTEAEWEYACRAGEQAAFNTGTPQLTGRQAVIYDAEHTPYQAAVAVGMYPPNAWGLFDMHGNLAEWCTDWRAPYPAQRVIDPTGPANDEVDEDFFGKVVRGGSWVDEVSKARCAARSSQLPVVGSDIVGFRVVLEADSLK